jgi:hypothetical protein
VFIAQNLIANDWRTHSDEIRREGRQPSVTISLFLFYFLWLTALAPENKGVFALSYQAAPRAAAHG